MGTVDAMGEIQQIVKAYHIADSTGEVLKDNPNICALCIGLGIDLESARIEKERTRFDSPMEGAMLSYALNTFLSSEYDMNVEAQYALYPNGNMSVFVKNGNRAVYQFRNEEYLRLVPAMPVRDSIPLIAAVHNGDNYKLVFTWRNLTVHNINEGQYEIFASCFAGLKARLEKLTAADTYEIIHDPVIQNLFYTAIGSFARAVVDRPFDSIHTKSRTPVRIKV